MAEFATHSGLASMIQHNVFDDRKAKARSAGFPRTRFIDSIETLEQARQMFGWNARAEVSNIELKLTGPLYRSDLNLLAARSVFQSIVDQVREYLVDRILIGQNLGVWRVGNLDC